MKRLLFQILRFLLSALQRVLSIISLGHWPSAVAACAIIVDDKGRLLLINRADGAGLGLPGGFIRMREPVEDAVCREVREETGVRVQIVAFVGHLSGPRCPGIACVDVIYHAQVIDPENARIQSSFEGECDWYVYEQIRSRLAFDYDKILAPFMRNLT
ncbi:MAG: NUDIX hydrolase [Phycisphaerales bacterium]|nr:NUDIX hydrolase [Phycisphaerales bacterium]